MDKKFLKEIINTPSPSGGEYILQRKIKEYMKEYSDNQISDDQGDLINIINENSSYKILLASHCDEISLIVDGYNSDGTLKVSANGGVSASIYLGSHVDVVLEDDIIHGVVGTNHSLDKKGDLKAHDLFVDIGLNLKETKKLVPLGTYIVHSSGLYNLKNNFFSARALDDRLGVFITQSALIKAKEKGAKVGVYAASTVGEETTMRGAYYVSSKIKPNFAIVVDVTYSSDYIGSDVRCDIDVGKGGVICHGSLPNKKLNKLLKETAKKLNLPIQEEVWPARTCTDADTIIKTNEGTPIILFSIPLRYMHSPVEVASYKDVESMIEILSEFILDIEKLMNQNNQNGYLDLSSI